MALSKATFQISFTGGTQLLALQNGVFQNPGQLNKRNGYLALTTNVLGGGSIASGVLLSNFQNELVLMDGQSLYSYSPDMTAWVNKGTLLNAAGTVSAVARDATSLTQPDCVFHPASGLKCFTYMDNGLPSYSIIDTTTGLNVVTNQALATNTFTSIKVLPLGNYFLVLLQKANGISYIPISVTSPQTPGSRIDFISSLYQTWWDATLLSTGSVAIAWFSNSTTCNCELISPIFVTTGPYSFAVSNAVTGSVSIVGDGVVGYGTSNSWISWISAAGVYCTIVNPANTTNLLAPTLVLAQNSNYPFVNVTGYVNGTTQTFFIEGAPTSGTLATLTNPGGNELFTATLTFAGVAATGSFGGLTNLANLGLASKAFYYNGTIYFLAIYAGSNVPPLSGTNINLITIEPTLFLLNSSGVAVAKFAKENAGTYFTSGRLPETPNTTTGNASNGNYFFPIMETVSVTTVSGVPVYSYGISQATFNFLPTVEPPSVQIGNSLIVASGITASYDGKHVTEQNFHTYPENIRVLLAIASGGIGPGAAPLSVEKFQYAVTWEWADGQGQVHRSTPSVPATFSAPVTNLVVIFTGNVTVNSTVITSATFTAGTLFVGQVISQSGGTSYFPAGTTITNISGTTLIVSNPATATATGVSVQTYDINAVTVAIPPLPLTQKPLGTVNAVVYRTQCNGTVFYKVTSLVASRTAGLIYIDTVPDSQIIGNPQLYTDGEIEDSGPPQFSAMTTFKSRGIGVPTENPYGIQYSKQVVPAPAGTASEASPVEFSSSFTQSCDAQGGVVTAVGVIDDKLILFKANTIFYMAGSGPAASGTQNDFTDPQLINSNVGCSNPPSVVSTPFGLMFQAGNNGIWLLDRSLAASYIGSGVDSYNSYTVTASELVSSQNQVRFMLSNGICLVYDYYIKQWSTFTNVSAVSVASYNGNFAYLTSAGVVNVETPGTFTDDGSFIPMSLTTAWIQLAKLQGFQRVWRAYILGVWKSAHTLNVTTQVDFLPAAVQTVTIPVTTSPSTAYQYRIHMLRQKCEAMQFTIYDTQSSSYGEGYSISGLTLDVGIETASGVKLPAAQSY
jgi:hypothetical protein